MTLRSEALSLGFAQVATAPATALDNERAAFEQWLAAGHHGDMQYLATDLDTRLDPRRLLEGCQTVIVLAHTYLAPAADAQQPLSPPEGVPKIARYAWGEDYHPVLKRKLHSLGAALTDAARAQGVPLRYRACVDSAPVHERAWAVQAGLGWQGKNTLVLTPTLGSYFFLAVLLVDVAITLAGGRITDHCGTCTRCVDACPTQALEPYRMNATKCISYNTIENKSIQSEPERNQTEGWAFGCDICQEVCPWNRFAEATPETAFWQLPHTTLTAEAWRAQTPSQFKKLTRPTAMSRIRREKWLDNLDAAGS